MSSWIDLDDLKARLMKRVTVEANGCWSFNGSHASGYGQMARGKGSQHPIRTHVASYMIFVGEVPRGLHVCHKCHNKGCCNPKHLYVGTRKDNMGDWARENEWKKKDEDLPYREEPTRSEPSMPSLANSPFARIFPKLDEEE